MPRPDGRLSNKARGLVLLTALLLGAPAIGMLWTNDAKRERWENRTLAPFPPLGGHGQEPPGFFAALDDWIDDHFALALQINRLHRRMRFYLFRDSPSPQISLGRGGFVYLNAHDAGNINGAFVRLCDRGPVEGEYQSLARSWMHLLERLQGHGLDQDQKRNVVLGIAPTKPVVYPDRLPESVPKAIREACLAYRQGPPPALRLTRDAERRGLRVVYPLDIFIAHRDDGNFFPKESFHFSGQSAQRFAETLMRTVGIDSSPIDAARRYEGRTKADLQQIFGFDRSIHVTQTDYSAFRSQLLSRQPDFVASGYARALDFGTYQTAAPLTERNALILSDSFGAFTARHLAAAYRSLTWINVSALQDGEGPKLLDDCLARIPAQDLFFVFHDGSAMWDGRRLEHLFFGAQ